MTVQSGPAAGGVRSATEPSWYMGWDLEAGQVQRAESWTWRTFNPFVDLLLSVTSMLDFKNKTQNFKRT